MAKLARKVVLVAVLLGTSLSTTGCITTSWKHNRRHLRKIVEDFIELHHDFDRVVFGMEPNPGE